MGVLDKFLNVMRLNSDDEDDFYDDDYDLDDSEEEVVAPRKKEKSSYGDEYKSKPAKAVPKVTPIRPSKKQNSLGMEVCVIRPTSIEDSREITETLLDNHTVVLNMEGLDVDVAQRIIDFTSGSCFAVNGNLQKISNYIFILTPESVDVSGDFLNIVDTFDARGLQTDL